MNKRQRTGFDAEEVIPDDEQDAVSWLQRHAFAMKWELPVYSNEERRGEDHCPTFMMRCNIGPISVTADGKNKKEAKQNVARLAMNELRKTGMLPPEEVLAIKTPSQHLQELVQRQGWSVEFMSTQNGYDSFTCTTKINDKNVAREKGYSRKEARDKSALRAMQCLRPEPMSNPKALEIVQLALSHYSHLTKHIKVSSSGCVACFVMESRKGLEVVAMGNGTSCYCESLKPDDPNREMIMDAHAEVLARRSLLKYFYYQLEVAQRWDSNSIFQRAGRKFKLRHDVRFHLYVSVLPCGDAKMFSGNKFVRPYVGICSHDGAGPPLPRYDDLQSHWPCMSRKSEGLLRARLDTGESYSPLPSEMDDPIVQRLRKITCSDKILCWNILGVQGGLLSTFLEPIYLSSIVIGGKTYSHGAASRAFCCRAHDIAPVLTRPFRLNHPDIHFVGDGEVSGQQCPAGHGGQKVTANTWSWSSGDSFPERLDHKTGRPLHALQYLQKEKTDVEGVSSMIDSVSDLNGCVQANDWEEPCYTDVTTYSVPTSGLQSSSISSYSSPAVLSSAAVLKSSSAAAAVATATTTTAAASIRNNEQLSEKDFNAIYDELLSTTTETTVPESPPSTSLKAIIAGKKQDMLTSSSLQQTQTTDEKQTQQIKQVDDFVNGCRELSQVRVTCSILGERFSAVGTGVNKKKAKQVAAELMLEKLSEKFGPHIISPVSSISGSSLLKKYKEALLREPFFNKPAVIAIEAAVNSSPSSSSSSSSSSLSSVSVVGEKVLSEAQVESLNYDSAKKQAQDYQVTKAVLHSFFQSPRSFNGEGGMNQVWVSRHH